MLVECAQTKMSLLMIYSTVRYETDSTHFFTSLFFVQSILSYGMSKSQKKWLLVYKTTELCVADSLQILT